MNDFIWCLHCERTYSDEKPRYLSLGDGDILEMCPYEDCDGDTVLDAKAWEWVRECRPEYPEIPEKGKVYPLYPESAEA